MRIPGVFLGMGLLLLSALPIAGVEVSAEISDGPDGPIVSCRAWDLDDDALLKSLDTGATVRLTWRFRLDGTDMDVVRYAHRDSLGEGYLLYGNDPTDIYGPYNARELMAEFSVLRSFQLQKLGAWNPGDVLESRLYIDSDLRNPALAVASIIGGSRDRSPRITTSYTGNIQR